MTARWSRRAFLGATLPWLAACSTPLPFGPRPSSDKAGTLRLEESAEAHGWGTYRSLADVSISYEGQWRAFVGSIQPEVVDAGFRGRSQERLIPMRAIVAQSYDGPAGHKQVAWQRGNGTAERPGVARVWRNGQVDDTPSSRHAAALVAEGYGLFLFGPLWLVGRGLTTRSAGTGRVGGRFCDVVDVWLAPGLGDAALDRVSLYIDRETDVPLRIRFTLEGTDNTRGAVAEVDTFDHERRFGILWPMRSYERVVHPIRLPAHEWHVTGLDVNRGFEAADVAGAEFTGKATAPAAALGS